MLDQQANFVCTYNSGLDPGQDTSKAQACFHNDDYKPYILSAIEELEPILWAR